VNDATAIDILRAYPAAPHAIAWCELFLGPNQWDARDAWPALRDVGFEGALGVIRDTISEAIGSGEPIRHAEALAELDTPDFRRYLAAKLGAL
jgi:hypothetical protein